ncbi:MAG: hypothetical protein FJY95_13445 [Candidatus Handelsmanbacteria bacterium]|nr:hypothetical protein [Candidatus Handelsmanbacteria bacterium]
MDLSRPEVREHFVRHSIDAVERYPVQGLDLEFMRAIPFFARGQVAKAAHLNEFLRKLRGELDRIGRQRGCRLELSIWSGTPQNYRFIRRGLFPPEFCELGFHGIDLPTWIKEVAGGPADAQHLVGWGWKARGAGGVASVGGAGAGQWNPGAGGDRQRLGTGRSPQPARGRGGDPPDRGHQRRGLPLQHPALCPGPDPGGGAAGFSQGQSFRTVRRKAR